MTADTTTMTADTQLVRGAPGPPVDRAPRRVAGELTRRSVWTLTLAALALLVVYPVGRILWLSVSDPTTDQLAPQTFIDQFTSPGMWSAARNTVIMSAVSTALSGLVAVPMAWLCTRTNMPGRRAIRGLVFLTFMNPPILLGIAYIMIFGPNIGVLTGVLHDLGISSTIYSWWGLILVTACGSYAIIFMTVCAAMESLDADFENAATAHGATRTLTTLRVTLPLVRPAIASGALLAFVLALNSFGVQALIAIPAKIPLLTTTIYSFFSYPVQLTAAADQAVVLIVISLVVTILINGYIARRTFPTIVGKGLRPDRIDLSPVARAVGLCFSGLVVAASVVVPMCIVVLSAFVHVQGRGYALSNLSLDGFRKLLQIGDINAALRNSLLLGVASAIVMVVLALSLAYFKRQRTAGARVAKVVAEIPFVIPGIVLAVGLIAAYSRPPLVLYGTYAILIFAYVAKFLPIAFRFADNAMGQVGPELEEGVYAHGGNRWMAFRAVILPLVRRGLATAGVLAFVFAFNELSASILLIGANTQVASTVLLHYNEEGLISQMNAFATIIFGITAAAYLLVMRFAGRSVFTSTRSS